MIVGIVGAEAAKFTPDGERQARALIHAILTAPNVTEVLSGHCHLGGIDIWAEEEGARLGLTVTSYPPAVLSWEKGYKPRNIAIARRSDILHNIVVRRLPLGFTGMRFNRCYHCHTSDHVKSGGCWTMRVARIGILHVIDQEGSEP